MKREVGTAAAKFSPQQPGGAARKIPAARAKPEQPAAAKRPLTGSRVSAPPEPKPPPARPRRSVVPAAAFPGESPAKKAAELQRNLDEKEKFVKELQSEVFSLKEQLEKLQILNAELELQKDQLAQDLSAARLKEEEGQVIVPLPSQFFDLFNSLGDKQRAEKSGESERKTAKQPPPLPAPPPPPPPPPPPRSGKAKKPASMVELFQSLPRQKSGDARVSIVGELQNRSAHQLAIKSDVEKKGNFVRLLIERIRSADFESMDQVVAFVEWLDLQLSTLADERAVLKHFEWPEKKADAMREAAVEYRDLKRMEEDMNSFEDDPSLPCEVALKKMSLLLDKLERRLARVVGLREVASRSYREMKIPTDWMLNSGELMNKLKLSASTKLAGAFIKRVQLESAQETLLRGLAFAYRVYQVAGGLDRRTMAAFEELRRRVGTHPPAEPARLTSTPDL